MNKTLSLLAALALSTTVAFAQSDILVGDMNDDGQLSIGDITALTDAVLDPQKQRTITMKCDPNVSEPAAIAGQWRTVSGTTLSLTAEGEAAYSLDATVKGFEYYPFRGIIALLNEDGYATRYFQVVRLTPDYLVIGNADGSCSAYYPSDHFASGFVLSATSLSLKTGETQQLRIVATPDGAIMPSFVWASSDPTVATVTADGLVTAVKGGTCTITATANDGSGVKAECTVTVAEPHEYVDLGLPSGTLWATTNVGADKPEDYGYYFAWGETEPKSTYNWSTYFDSVDGSAGNFKKYYNNGGKTELDLEDDAAYMNWGEGWRMPSLEQLKELYNSKYTTTQWTTQNGKNGRLITSKQNGRSLFLPAAGYRYDGSLGDAGYWGGCWSRSLSASVSYYAFYLYFNLRLVDWISNYRYYGRSVRPVRVSASE